MKNNSINILGGIMIGMILSLVIIHFTKDNKIQPRSYQIQLHDSTATLYDGNREIGTFNYKYTELDQIILIDNQ